MKIAGFIPIRQIPEQQRARELSRKANPPIKTKPEPPTRHHLPTPLDLDSDSSRHQTPPRATPPAATDPPAELACQQPESGARAGGMPGPGAHLLYALSGGAALSRLAGPDRRFGPHHCAVYAANAFLGPDLGSFAEWLCSFLPPPRRPRGTSPWRPCTTPSTTRSSSACRSPGPTPGSPAGCSAPASSTPPAGCVLGCLIPHQSFLLATPPWICYFCLALF